MYREQFSVSTKEENTGFDTAHSDEQERSHNNLFQEYRLPGYFQTNHQNYMPPCDPRNSPESQYSTQYGLPGYTQTDRNNYSPPYDPRYSPESQTVAQPSNRPLAQEISPFKTAPSPYKKAFLPQDDRPVQGRRHAPLPLQDFSAEQLVVSITNGRMSPEMYKTFTSLYYYAGPQAVKNLVSRMNADLQGINSPYFLTCESQIDSFGKERLIVGFLDRREGCDIHGRPVAHGMVYLR
jgi:hypothetical protein